MTPLPPLPPVARPAPSPLPRRGLPLRVLVLDDQAVTVRMLSRVLTEAGCDVLAASSVEQADSLLEQTVPDLAIIDVYLGDGDGLAYVRQLRHRASDLGILVISTEDSESLAAKAIESGADDFLSKPVAPEALRMKARTLSELRDRRVRTRALEEQLHRRAQEEVFGSIVTHCDVMRGVFAQIEKVAPRDLSVLVHGESGTGKELVARALHGLGRRRSGPFVEVNCAALPPSLVESELFGHEKGAFTGAIATRAGKLELAHGGTLLLDEIGELPLEIQPKLLRALQERRIVRVGGTMPIPCDFRLVSATNRDLLEEVRTGRFREDLYYRLAVFPIQLPPLRERRADVLLLLQHFLRAEGAGELELSDGARALLLRYPWPGNVRELKNFAQAIAILSDRHIEETHVRHYFGARLRPARPEEENGHARGLPPGSPGRPVRPLAALEREEIEHALLLHAGNVPEAARALGMGRATLYKYLKREGIDLARLTQGAAGAAPALRPE